MLDAFADADADACHSMRGWLGLNFHVATLILQNLLHQMADMLVS